MLRHIEPHERNNLDTGEGILWRITLRSRDSITIFFSYSSQATYKIMVNNSKLFDCICSEKLGWTHEERDRASQLYVFVAYAHAYVCACTREKYVRKRCTQEWEMRRKKKRERKWRGRGRRKGRWEKLFLKGCVGPRRCRWGPWFALRRLPGLAWILNSGKQLALPDAL